MLTAKYVQIHGLRDERWTTKDKLNQYRGVLKLHARDKKLREINNEKLKKQVGRKLDVLSEDVRQCRGVLHDIVSGDRVRMRATLKHYRTFQLAYQNHTPGTVKEAVHQDCELRRRQLDKIYYEKKRKVEEFLNLQLKRAELLERYEQDQEDGAESVQQKLITRFQRAVAKQNAAKAIRLTYIQMINILRKDRAYFDAVLIALKEDQRDQCKVMFKTTVMGQLVAEELDDLKKKYKRMKNDVLINMRERERTLEIAREQVEDIWGYCQSLVRVESDPDLGKVDKPLDGNHHLDKQIKQLEEIVDKLKESLLVRSYHEILPRLEEQVRQKIRLLGQFEHTLKQRDSFLSQTEQAELVLTNLKHTMITGTTQYRTDKKAMLEQLEIQKKREQDNKNTRKVRGELLMKIRAALQNMTCMLMLIKRGSRGARKLKDKKSKESMADRDETEDEKEGEDTVVMEKIHPDGLVLLSTISRKVGALFGMSNFDLDEDREHKARDLYQTYVSTYRSVQRFGKGEPEPTGLIVEHEAVDPNVPTHADIKLRSKQIVEAHTKPE